MKTTYYMDKYEIYNKISLKNKIFNKINILLKSTKIANIAGIVGAILPVMVILLK